MLVGAASKRHSAYLFIPKIATTVFIGSTLDYLFVSPLLANYLHSSSVGLQFQSDHCPLEATFLLNRNPRGPGIFHFPGYLLGDTSFCSILTDMIQEIVSNCDEGPPSLLWDGHQKQNIRIYFRFQGGVVAIQRVDS